MLKKLLNLHIEIHYNDDDLKKKFNDIPEYIISQRSQHISIIKNISSILLAANSTALLFLLNNRSLYTFSFWYFIGGIFLSIISALLVYGLCFDTYTSTLKYIAGNQSFVDLIQYDYKINTKCVIFEIFLIILSFSGFLLGVFNYV